MTLAERLTALELSPIPVWVFDPEMRRIRWANEPALELWTAKDREELLNRDFRSTPNAVAARFEVHLQALREGRTFWDEWTFFPRGAPVHVRMHFANITLDDGRIGVLQHVIPRAEKLDPAELRGISAFNYTSVIVAVVDFEGAVLLKNPAAITAFGTDADDWKEWLTDPAAAERMLGAARAGEVPCAELRARTLRGERWHAVEVRPTRDAVTGKMVALIHHTDESARREAEQEVERERSLVTKLDQSLRLVEQQRQEILALSAPVLEVGAGVLALPVIGALDRARAAEIVGRLLTAISERQTRVVILDLTGAAALDGASAALLLQMIRAIKLLGAQPIVTGIRPALAALLVESGFDMSAATILRSLADGIHLSTLST